MVIVVTAGLGVWPASYIVRSETSSLRLRSKTSGLGWLCGGIIRCVAGFSVPYLYNADAANLGAKTAFVFFGTSLIGVVITWFLVPELKGLSITEIDRLFEKNSSVRWERVERGDDLALQGAELGHERTNSSAFTGDSGSIHATKPVEPFEPLRKRPTF